MKLRDLLGLSMQNLRRRKSRTFLTVLGVVIGCCSIVIMVSIGIGLRESQAAMLAQMGDLTMITVYPRGYGNSGGGAKLNDQALSSLRELPHVEAATPKVYPNFSATIYAGSDRRYMSNYTYMMGMDKEAVDKFGYEVLEGKLELGGSTDTGFTMIAGQYFEYNFYDTMRPEGMNMVDRYSMYQPDGSVTEPPEAYFNALEMPLTMEIYVDENTVLSYPIQVTGRVKEDYSKGYETSEGLLIDMKAIPEITRAIAQLTGQAVSGATNYDNVEVKVTDISVVSEVEGLIKEMGFETSSMESIREPMEEEAKQQMLLLGGLGAISLFVAALGITNTMIMSISERTREIGIMKALGCYVKDIRSMFLMEAGAIGLMGGIVGTVVSLLISAIMNMVSAGIVPSSLEELMAVLTNVGNRMSVIPPWLIAFSIGFSILIGLCSGYYPANKAVKIPALEAIKQE